MTRQQMVLAYGTQSMTLTVPDEALAGPLISPRKPAAGAYGGVEEALRKALAEPINSPQLRQMVGGRRVALVLSDEFRAGEHRQIARALIAEIAAGHPSSLTALIATGSHDVEVYGRRVAGYVEEAFAASGLTGAIIRINDCDDPASHIEAGRTAAGTPLWIHRDWLSAEVRVHGHEGKHHYMNGYSCFDKQIVPGVSMRASIEANHKLALHHDHSVAGRSPWADDPARRHNPFGEDSQEARRLTQQVILEDGQLRARSAAVFGLDMISEQGVVQWAAAGDTDEVTREMVRKADRLALFTVKPVQYVVISPGGPPACQALYGVQNCFDMALKGAIAQDGEALVIAPCNGRPDLPPGVSGLAPDVKAKDLFWDNLVRFIPRPLAEWERFVNDHFELYLWKTDRVLKLMKQNGVKLYLHSRLPDAVIRQGGFEPVADPQSWIDERAARGDGLFRFIDKGNKLLVLGQGGTGDGF